MVLCRKAKTRKAQFSFKPTVTHKQRWIQKFASGAGPSSIQSLPVSSLPTPPFLSLPFPFP